MRKFKILIMSSLIISFLTFNVAFSQDDFSEIIPLESSSNVILADIKSERIPVGTVLALRMERPVNSFNHTEGDPFSATLLEDIRIGSLIVLPAGTLIRGSAGFVKPNGYFRRGGELSLNFDHAVTPFGKQIPINVNVTRAKNLNTESVFTTGGSYSKTLGNNFDTSANILTTITTYCVDKGMSFWKGIPVAVAAPVGAIAGTFVGGSYFVGKSVYDMFKKGDNVRVNPGEIIEVTLIEPLDVPTN